MQLLWDIYEIQSSESRLHGVMLRGRIRKFTIENNIVCLTENASDIENTVRFALLSGTDSGVVTTFAQTLISNPTITKVMTGIENPILSKLKVNDMTRY